LDQGVLDGPTALTERIIGAAIEVHRCLGPGLLESVYETALAHELATAGLHFRRQVELPVLYKGNLIAGGFRADLLVEETVLLELKAVEQLLNVHKAQVVTYLRLANLPVGLLINFNVPLLRVGIRRLINASASPRLL
jgi:GxxExxY protein